jgi:hypothetical protein
LLRVQTAWRFFFASPVLLSISTGGSFPAGDCTITLRSFRATAALVWRAAAARATACFRGFAAALPRFVVDGGRRRGFATARFRAVVLATEGGGCRSRVRTESPRETTSGAGGVPLTSASATPVGSLWFPETVDPTTKPPTIRPMPTSEPPSRLNARRWPRPESARAARWADTGRRGASSAGRGRMGVACGAYGATRSTGNARTRAASSGSTSTSSGLIGSITSCLSEATVDGGSPPAAAALVESVMLRQDPDESRRPSRRARPPARPPFDARAYPSTRRPCASIGCRSSSTRSPCSLVTGSATRLFPERVIDEFLRSCSPADELRYRRRRLSLRRSENHVGTGPICMRTGTPTACIPSVRTSARLLRASEKEARSKRSAKVKRSANTSFIRSGSKSSCQPMGLATQNSAPQVIQSRCGEEESAIDTASGSRKMP